MDWLLNKFTFGALVVFGVICGALLPSNIILGLFGATILFFIFLFFRLKGPSALGIFVFLIPAGCFWAGVLVFLAGVGLSTRF